MTKLPIIFFTLILLLYSCSSFKTEYEYEELVEIYATIKHYSSWDFKYRLPIIESYGLDERYNQIQYQQALLNFRHDFYRWRQFNRDAVTYYIENFIDQIKDPIIKYYQTTEFREGWTTFSESTEIEPTMTIATNKYYMVYYYQIENQSEAVIDRVYRVEYYENQFLKYRAFHDQRLRAIKKIFFNELGEIEKIVWLEDDQWGNLEEEIGE